MFVRFRGGGGLAALVDSATDVSSLLFSPVFPNFVYGAVAEHPLMNRSED